jgi:LPXTG-site transpeptidase (sortase) family protein
MNPELEKILKVPKPPQKLSITKLIGIFVGAFIIILILLNAPTIGKTIAYPFTHSVAADNEQLTQQYRDIYGYDKHPELITSVENNNTHAPTPSVFPVAPAAHAIPAGYEMRISIPKLNITAPVLQVADSNDSTILAALKNGVVLYPGSSNPGQTGTTVIVGHSSSTPPWTKYSAIFSLLDKLQPDDIIYITVNGTQYAYRVRTVQKGSAQQLLDSGLAGDLIVSTCWPIGTDAKRIAVSASLVQ